MGTTDAWNVSLSLGPSTVCLYDRRLGLETVSFRMEGWDWKAKVTCCPVQGLFKEDALTMVQQLAGNQPSSTVVSGNLQFPRFFNVRRVGNGRKSRMCFSGSRFGKAWAHPRMHQQDPTTGESHTWNIFFAVGFTHGPGEG